MSALILALVMLPRIASAAFVAEGGTGIGADVTVKDNGDDTVTMSNGIASIVIVKRTGRLNSITYTYDHDGKPTTSETLSGKGQYYYGGFSLGNGVYEYSLATDPAGNGGDYADVRLLSITDKNGIMEIHFSMLRGSPGFYSTAMMTHRKQDERFEVGAWGVITRVPPAFNWVSADEKRHFYIGTPSRKIGPRVPDAPHEITVSVDGTQAGRYADKFIYSQDHGDRRTWGWSSVGADGLNIGRWMMTTMEFSNGGPLKRDVGAYPSSELTHYMLSGEVGMGSDGFLEAGEVWTKTCGPWFIFLNHVPASLTDAKQAAQMLFADAEVRAAAEEKAWPYAWFKHEAFVPASLRGTVQGTLVIKDGGNPNASSAGLWVGLQQQPQTYKGFYDFQKWSKTYQFWVKTDAEGHFTIPNVIPGENYLLWAFGSGAAGTFLSQKLAGGQPPFECNLPAEPFTVSVKAGETRQLGTLAWTPVRTGPTVFELGTPNRKSDEFRHGEDYWAPAPPPQLGYPTPVWGGQMEFPLDFPDGMTYTVGESRWPRDWNYVLPAMADTTGQYQPCSGTIVFHLPHAPAEAAQASLYMALAGNNGDKVVIRINGVNLGGTPGVTATPSAIASAGFSPAYSDTSSIHFSDHGPFNDERITFPAKLLNAGRNTLTITMDSRKMVSFLMVDYLRLELPGYVPPAPSSVTAYAGNHRVLVAWPVVPGATSYEMMRSTSEAGKYVPLSTNVIGPVCGSGPSRATYVDTDVFNGTTYYYLVHSVNPAGRSVASPQSAGATPSTEFVAVAPPPPASVTVTGSGHHQVALHWAASPGANYYTVRRSTLHADGVGGLYSVGTILLEDAATGTTYTDQSPSDGRDYSYLVEAISAGGTSAPSQSVSARPLPGPPAAAPEALRGKWTTTRDGDAIALNWLPVPGATGYVLYRITGDGTIFQWPDNFLTALVETTYIDKGDIAKDAKVKGLDTTRGYSYRVTAVNAGGISPSTTVRVAASK